MHFFRHESRFAQEVRDIASEVRSEIDYDSRGRRSSSAGILTMFKRPRHFLSRIDIKHGQDLTLECLPKRVWRELIRIMSNDVKLTMRFATQEDAFWTGQNVL